MKRIDKFVLFMCVALWASALSAQTHFSFVFRSYDMTIYYTLTNYDGNAVEHPESYEIAAFVGDECRGVGEYKTAIGENGQELTYGYLRVWSDNASGETVTFKFFDKTNEEEGEVEKVSVDFSANDLIGMPSSPMALVVEKAPFILGDVNDDGTVDISDYIGVANHILGNTPEGFNATAADVNNDGSIDISDYIGVANIILTGKP